MGSSMYMQSKGITLLHTADLHLGFLYGGLKEKAAERQQDNQETFLYIISLCRERNVDILLIAGDLFDTPVPDRELLKTVRKAFAVISETLVVISPGNHDYYEPGGIYDDIESWSDNVFIFHGEMDCFEFNIRGETVRIYGAAFTGQYQREPLMKQRRLTGDGVISIGLFHGELGTGGWDSKYNRITPEQIEENRFSYTALGHIHRAEGISYAGQAAYAYCGSPEGHGFDETGGKGVWLGSITGEECNLEFFRTCRRQYIVEKICIEGFESAKQLADYLLLSFRNRYGGEYKDYLYQLKFYGSNRQDIDLERVGFCLRDLYYIEIKDETETVLKEYSRDSGEKFNRIRDEKRTTGKDSLEVYFEERMRRLITAEEAREDRDENRIKRYRRALQLGLEAVLNDRRKG
ncbi:MAG: DNA repair exonuclease [Lachnospiraceae bacterium]|nr:DNA repair exonuclease [Lachnospiraceae bacterium]